MSAQNKKAIAKKIAQQIAQEPLEILKTAKEQVTGTESSENIESKKTEQGGAETVQDENYKLKQEVQGQRILGALNQELKDISREKLFADLQRKISEGMDVYLEEYPDLTMEQKQVLKAQIEAVKQRQAMANQDSVLPEPTAKKGRKMGNFFGKKTSMKREQTRVEKVNPPSG